MTCAIRLLGIGLSNLVPAERQLSSFDRAPLHRTVDHVRERYGYDALRLALSGAEGDD